jgi:predicted ATP-grasp superfamily ATP-dependent carboligase
MRPPEELYSIHSEPSSVDGPVLVYAFAGFVDAGAGVRLAADHLLASCEHRLIATFDVDEVFDYRARRPRMSYVVDHFASVEIPQITLHEVTDSSGVPFLLLVGPEPDYQWQRFIAAVEQIVDRFGVRLAIGLTAVPWPAPHTRPLGITVHGSEPSLLENHPSVLGEIEVPGHVSAMLELRLGERGTPSMGITAQVPHYLVQFEYPNAATALLDGLATVTAMSVPRGNLVPAAARAEREIAQQLEGNDEFATVVSALEQQYDQMGHLQSGAGGGLADLAPAGGVPTGDEIAAMVEEFLQGLAGEADEGKTEG